LSLIAPGFPERGQPRRRTTSGVGAMIGSVLIGRPFLPMRRNNIDEPLRFGIDKRASGPAAGKQQLVHDTLLDDGEPQVAINRNVGNLLNEMPHAADQAFGWKHVFDPSQSGSNVV